MSVEFVSHITRSFSICVKEGRLERAEYALATMGSSVSERKKEKGGGEREGEEVVVDEDEY